MTLPLLYPAIQPLLAGRRRYCRCVDASWDIDLKQGRCRLCGLEVHHQDVRRLQSKAQSQIAHLAKKVWPEKDSAGRMPSGRARADRSPVDWGVPEPRIAAAAARIDPATAVLDSWWAHVADPYGLGGLPTEAQCVGRLYFFADPVHQEWIWEGDVHRVHAHIPDSEWQRLMREAAARSLHSSGGGSDAA